MSGSRPTSVWLAAAVAIAIVAWGLTETLNLVNQGDVSVFSALLTLIALVLGTFGFWSMRWWGLALAACGVIYLSVFSAISGLPSTLAAVALFYLPMAIVAGLNHSRFKW